MGWWDALKGGIDAWGGVLNLPFTAAPLPLPGVSHPGARIKDAIAALGGYATGAAALVGYGAVTGGFKPKAPPPLGAAVGVSPTAQGARDAYRARGAFDRPYRPYSRKTVRQYATETLAKEAAREGVKRLRARTTKKRRATGGTRRKSRARARSRATRAPVARKRQSTARRRSTRAPSAAQLRARKAFARRARAGEFRR